ncbi:hypothetical protein [Nocardiopsis trehalosi]|jgi:hypothetical protein|uniref:hypothetical protein n=1 Tax=Nocardiopsis trehalosi TaxID=109329 RepID=UPI00082E3CCD|nr:hypothetical protein [Nocardiopsis trehalosi]
MTGHTTSRAVLTGALVAAALGAAAAPAAAGLDPADGRPGPPTPGEYPDAPPRDPLRPPGPPGAGPRGGSAEDPRGPEAPAEPEEDDGEHAFDVWVPGGGATCVLTEPDLTALHLLFTSHLLFPADRAHADTADGPVLPPRLTCTRSGDAAEDRAPGDAHPAEQDTPR